MRANPISYKKKGLQILTSRILYYDILYIRFKIKKMCSKSINIFRYRYLKGDINISFLIENKTAFFTLKYDIDIIFKCLFM